MRKYVFIAIGYLVLAGALSWALREVKDANGKLSVSQANVKSYASLLGDEKAKSVAFQLTASQLEGSRDSVMRELDGVRKELKIKQKDLKSVQVIKSVFSKSDTIVLRDTVFRDVGFAMDTVVGDEWCKVGVGLKWPSRVSVNPEFKSEKTVVVSAKRETVDPPKKCWLLRIFQKKHTVVRVDVVEKNPYVKDERSEYVEIVK